MNPKLFWLITAIFLVPLHRSEAQQKVSRLGYLSNTDAANDSARAEGIRLALRERGYIEGQNIAIEYRYSEGRRDRAPELAAELVRLKVDIIVVAGGETWIRAAKNATKTIPLVMVGIGIEPVKAGLVKSLARPGGNVTGITALGRELGGKRLEPSEARAADDFEKVFAAMSKERPDGLVVTGGTVMRPNRKRIAGFALKSRLPSVSSSEEFVDAGGLMSYAADDADNYRRVAIYVDKILKGAKPGDLPVEQPTKFELVINLKTAQQIGVTITQKVLARADRVIR